MPKVPNLSRRGHLRSPLKKFVILCEGRNTEPSYFRMIKNLYKDCNLDIRPGVGSPISIATEARRIRRKTRSPELSFARDDEVWVVFDRDEHARWNEAIQICRDAGVSIAYSNPCFELWLILHHQDFEKPDDRHQVQALTRTLFPEYDPEHGKTVDCKAIRHLVQEAESRAAKQLSRREEEGTPFHGVPSTTVFKLTKSIRTWRS